MQQGQLEYGSDTRWQLEQQYDSKCDELDAWIERERAQLEQSEGRQRWDFEQRFERDREELQEAIREDSWHLEQGCERERWELEQNFALEYCDLEQGCSTQMGTGEMAHLTQGVEVLGRAELGQVYPPPGGESSPEEEP